MPLPPLLEPLARDPEHGALVTDYDGTLSPIVDDPARAVPMRAAIEALRELSTVLGLVGVISGRPVSFLREHVPVPGAVLVGQYGLERQHGDEVVLDPRAVPFVEAVTAAAGEAERQWPDLLVERKGDVAFTVHWRAAPDAAPQRDDLVALAERHGLVTQPGRMACELRTPVPVDKAVALDEVVPSSVTTVAFAGDDEGDLAVFRSARAGLVRIGVRSDESPAAVVAEADLVVDGPPGLAALLADLATEVSRLR